MTILNEINHVSEEQRNEAYQELLKEVEATQGDSLKERFVEVVNGVFNAIELQNVIEIMFSPRLGLLTMAVHLEILEGINDNLLKDGYDFQIGLDDLEVATISTWQDLTGETNISLLLERSAQMYDEEYM